MHQTPKTHRTTIPCFARMSRALGIATWVALCVILPEVSVAQSPPPSQPSKMTPRSSATPNAYSVEGEAKARTVATRLTAFSIPFKVDNASENYIEVQLYLSRDQGKTWQFHSRQKPDAGEFPFRSSGDGEYWFSLKTLDRNRQLVPDGKITRPELIVVVDTEIPELDANVQSDAAGRVVCRWLARDPNLLPETLRIQYRPAHTTDDTGWMQVPVKLNPQITGDTYADQLGWWPASTDSLLLVRIEIADAAGNIARQERTVATRRMAQLRNPQSTAIGGPIASNGWRPAAPATAAPDRTARTEPPRRSSQLASQSSMFQNQAPVGSGVTSAQLSNASAQPFPPNGSPEIEFSRRPDFGNEDPGTTLAAGSNDRAAAQAWPSQPQSWPGRPESVSNSSSIANTAEPADPLLRTTMPTTTNRIPLGPTQIQEGMTVREEGDLVIAESTARGRGVQYGTSRDLPVRSNTNTESTSTEGNAVSPDNRQTMQSASTPSESQYTAGAFPASTTGYPPADDRPFENLPLNHSQVDRAQSEAVQNAASGQALVQYVNTRRFALHYQVHSVDPASIARVVLWMTRDDGRHWESWATDPDLQSPILVDVEHEGRYGFRIVVHSRDGLTGHAPAPGDAPEMIVDVDWTAPTIEITEAPYGRGPLAGHLIIQWRAADAHLAERPIRIFYATTPNGPWTILASRQPNSGQFAWKITEDTPPRVYLRVEAVDLAGNVAADHTATPIDLTGLIPSGRILGLQKIGDHDQ